MRLRFIAATAAMLACSVAAHADDLFTLTSGSSTISFELPSSPAITGTESAQDGFYFNSVPVNVNGMTSNKEIAFYVGGGKSYGGLSIEGANQGADYDSGTGLLLDQMGSQLFSGTIKAPTFLIGSYALTTLSPNQFSPKFTTPFNLTVAATPEPSSLALLGTGVLGLIGVARRRFVGA